MEHEQDDPGVDLPLDDSLESEPICDDPTVDSNSNRIVKADDSGSNEHPNIYRHDIVRNNKTGSIGVVSEVAGDSDSESDISDEQNDGSDDDDEDDDDDDDDAAEEEGKKANEDNVGRGEKKAGGNYKCGTLEGDQIRVLWMDDTEPVQDVNNVTVVDRGFLHGDYVASSSDPTGQVGVVVDVDMSVDLLALDGSTHKDISTKELKRVRDFCVGDYVVHGPWLGRIDDVLDNVTVLFDDGSMCRVLRAEPLQLKPVSQSSLEEDANFPYYPGQRVKATSSSVFKSSRWLSGLWKPNRLEGTVTKVTAGSIFVYWIASAGFGPDSAVSPPEEQSPSNLTLLSSFTHANWQVGDWGLLPSVNQSATIPLHKHVSKLRLYDSQARKADREQNKSDLEDEASVKSEPVGITAEALPKETTVSSTSKEPAHEPWPLHRKKIRKLVIRKDKRVKKKEESFERALLIVNSRTLVDVAWQDGTVEYRREATTLIPIETPGDQEFVPEQYVVEKASDEDDNTTEPKRVGVVKSVNAKERTASVRWLKPRLTAEEPREFDKEEIASVYELEVHPDYDYCYGDIVVRLSPVTMALPASSKATEQDNGHQDAEYHQEAIVRDKEQNDVDMNLSELSWVGNITGLKDGDIEVTWADGMVSTVGPQAIYVVGRDDDESIAAESEASDAASWETVDDDDKGGAPPEEDLGRGSFLEENSDAENNGENDSGRNGALALPLAAVEFMTRMASGIFSRGQKTEDSSSSSLTDDNGYKQAEVTNSSQERGSFLDDHSPTNFSATDNCDSEGTVLENEAVERSEGEKSEEPIPSESDSCSFKRFDISQDPLDHHYLGSDEQKTKERRWFKKVDQDWKILQNNLPDGIFVRVYEDRMDLLRAVIAGAYGTPYQDGLFFFDFHLPSDYPSVPPDFEELIKDHFRKRGYYILKACDAYMKGYLIGSLSKDASVIDVSCSANSNSVGFKLMLAKIAPKLFTALSEVGADCNEFKHLQQQQ
ncbi:hypothetical protein DY000_02005407 [Brassica cretica]|uniref:UBC core domain-containing protein n=1 Tax=Brassica cretica TaxID=69181 RepID=A0ABQ7CDL8_BRACR|nr:hypothetical protein DY000_02005407 [Brassica cretica]